ncbi:MAG: S41 family peptidase [Actinomycetes bacterium]
MLRAVPRRLIRGVALVAALALAYAGGLVTGVVGTRVDDGAGPARGVVDEAAQRIERRAAGQVDRDELDRAAVQGMLDALDDRWSTYYTASEYEGFQRALQGRYSGVGMWLRTRPDGAVDVASVQRRSPAGQAGVHRGDQLVLVDGRPVAGLAVASVASWLRGPGGSTVTLRLRTGDATRTVQVTRAEVETENVTVDQLDPHLARIRITAFSQGVGRHVRQALAADPASWRGGVVLDVRGNPGGLVEEAVAVAGLFLDSGPVVTYERRGRPPRTLHAARGGNEATSLVVLVDQDTASAAELLAASLQDRNRAVVVGSRTVGKGSVQEPARLSDGSALSITVGRYLTPSGRSVEGVGVEPDVLVPPDAPVQVAERRATEVLTGLTAALTSGGRG